MPSRRAPEPEYVVLCSETVDWHSDAELLAACGRPMLLHGSTRRDLEFVRSLMKKHHLSSTLDLPRQRYLVWKTDPLPPPQFRLP